MTKIYKISNRGPVEEHEYMLKMELPKKLASWDVWDYWERARFVSMMGNVEEGDIFFDIGTEFGATSALIQKYLKVKMVMFEPMREMFRSIKWIWENNKLEEPISIFNGFASGETKLEKTHLLTWEEIKAGEVENRAYLNLNNSTQKENVSEITIDDYVKKYKLIPRVLNIDVEGAEMNVINGATGVLKRHKPLIWMSIHDDLLKYYGYKEKDILKKLKDLGYREKLLSIDHEKHYFFE